MISDHRDIKEADKETSAEALQDHSSEAKGLSPKGIAAIQGESFPLSTRSGDGKEVAGWENVPLAKFSDSQIEISGPEDFKKISYERMVDGIQKLETVVRPAVEQGQGESYFEELDRKLGITNPVDGYEEVYKAFYGQDHIRLDAREDGSYSITDGRHRLYVAKQLGLESLPARVVRPRKT